MFISTKVLSSLYLGSPGFRLRLGRLTLSVRSSLLFVDFCLRVCFREAMVSSVAACDAELATQSKSKHNDSTCGMFKSKNSLGSKTPPKTDLGRQVME